MNYVILNTRITPPSPGKKFINRSRLSKQIIDSLIHPPALLLISAPSGYGKTVIAVEAVKDSHRVAWLTLSQSENDIERFMAYLSASINLVVEDDFHAPEFSKDKQYLFEQYLYQIQKLPFTLNLVFDNLQEIIEPEVIEFVKFLVFNQSENINIILISQEDPLFELTRLRTAGILTELREKDLSFSAEEIGLIFKEFADFALSDDERESIMDKTEGWPLAVMLSAISFTKQTTVKNHLLLQKSLQSNEYIIDYFANELMSGISEKLRSFIIITAFLGEFCAPLCDYLRNSGDSSELLKIIKNKHLPVMCIDIGEKWYRYHFLFRDYIKEKYPAHEPADLADRRDKWLKNQKLIPQDHTLLSKREIEILTLAAAGENNSDIGDHLFISTGTVKWHMNNIFNKLDVKNRAQAVNEARKRTLLT